MVNKSMDVNQLLLIDKFKLLSCKKCVSSSFAIYTTPILVSATVYSLLLVASNRQLNDGDTLWHIILGQKIISSWHLPQTDEFSQLFYKQPYWTNSWLSDVILALAYNTGGFAAVVTVSTLSIAIAFYFIQKEYSLRNSDIAGLIVCTACFVLLSPHLLSRPHVLVFPLVVLWTRELMRADDAGTLPSYRILPVLFFWTNMHGSFVLGYVIAAPVFFMSIYRDGEIRSKNLILSIYFIVGMALSSIVGPYGIRPMTTAFSVINLGDLLNNINEWQPQSFSSFSGFEAIILFWFGFMCLGQVKLSANRILLILGLIHMALMHVRNADYLALIGSILMCGPLCDKYPGNNLSIDMKVIYKAISGGALIATCIIYFPGLVHPSNQAYPYKAIEYVKSLDNLGNVFNDYTFSGALIFNEKKVFIDSRTEFYPKEFFREYIDITNGQDSYKLNEYLNRYDIGWAILDSNLPVIKAMNNLTNWMRVYSDNEATVYVKNSSKKSDY